jgi:8-oxo-dGTP pyrophosphatase MutT (NUDIX family)
LADQNNPWKLLDTEIGFDCPYYLARRDTVLHRSGRTHPYVSVRMKTRGVAVVPVDATGCTTIVGQFRYVLDRFTWEAIRGGIPANVSPLDGAKQERLEETGLRADHWLHLFDLTASPGLTDEIAPCFVAWGLEHHQPLPEEEEVISQRHLPFAEVVTMVLTGEIFDAASVSLILAIQTRLARR